MNNADEILLKEKPTIVSQIKKIWAIAFYAFRAQLRNPATFAFGFIFPIVFISVFGLISSGGGLSIKLGIPEGDLDKNPVYQALTKIDSVKIERGKEADLRGNLQKGKLDGLLVIKETSSEGDRWEDFLKLVENPNDYFKSSSNIFAVTLETTLANPQTSGTVKALVAGVIDKLNLSLTGVDDPPISYNAKQVSGRESRYIDFALPGQIGFALLSTAIFGTAFGLIFLKKTLVLKRIFATPTLPISIILGQGLSRLITAILQTIIILAFGVFVFKFHLANGYITFFEMLLLSTMGLVVFLGFGLLISGIFSDENSVAPVANLITLPQFLLSGTFFPTDSFPGWVQPIANHLPLYYLNEAMRKVATEGAAITEIWTSLVALLIWGVAAYLVASRTFKWQ